MSDFLQKKAKTISTDYTITASDCGVVLVCSSTSAIVLTVPNASTLPFFNFTISNAGTANVTCLSKTIPPGAHAHVANKDNTAWDLVLGAPNATSTTTANITADIAVGAVTIGSVIPTGSTLQDVVTQIFAMTYNPTFSAPTATLTSNVAASVECGTTSAITFTLTLNRGAITGALNNGVWDAGLKQADRAGAATNYTIDGVDRDLTNTYVKAGQVFALGANTFTGIVDYAQGPQPLNSKNGNYSTPLSEGSLSPTVTVTGYRKSFYGTDSSTSTAYSTSAQVRALSGGGLNPAAGTTFTINIPIGARQVIFAYPATLRDVNTVKYVEGMNAEVKDVFTKYTFNVEGASSYTAASYKVYCYSPVSPFDATATYNVTI